MREIVPGGYELTNQKVGGETGEVDKDGESYSFTNRLAGKITISGQKIWRGVVGAEPDLTLERRLSGETEESAWTEVTVTNQPTWDKSQGDTWTFTYTGLDKYDEDGVLYEYRVREQPVPEGYEAGYTAGSVGSNPATPVDGLTITNYQDGSLTVSKTVSGNRGDQNEDFTFTVKLTGRSSAGTAASDVDDSFSTKKTDADGNATSGMITFADGVSGEFTLKHNESLTIQGLPAGIGYQVVEAERDRDGYSTGGTGWTGEIPAGDAAEAEFNNHRHDSGGGGEEADWIDLTGTKTWVDEGQGDPDRPGGIQLILERSVDGVHWERYEAKLTWTGKGTNTWTYTFHDLPERDEEGRRYSYRVSEVVPDGYEATQSGSDITNRKSEVEPGSLRVTKEVTGSAGDPTQAFTFTVTLSNRDLTGVYGEMTFVDGVAVFSLRGGESIRADNLPEGTAYTVTEAEADQDGYTTTAAGETGTITAGAVSEAVFVNDRTRDDPDQPDQPDEPDEPDQPDERTNPMNPTNRTNRTSRTIPTSPRRTTPPTTACWPPCAWPLWAAWRRWP